MSDLESENEFHKKEKTSRLTTKKSENEEFLKKIIENHFDEEIGYKQVELNEIEEVNNFLVAINNWKVNFFGSRIFKYNQILSVIEILWGYKKEPWSFGQY